MAYVVDTTIFNKLVDGVIAMGDLPSNSQLMATHVQIDELNNTKDNERRAQLFLKFVAVGTKIVPTESFVWDVSRWDHGKWSDGVLFEKLKGALDLLNKAKPNNSHDALIAEVAIVNDYTLLTADLHLAEVTEKHGGNVSYFGT